MPESSGPDQPVTSIHAGGRPAAATSHFVEFYEDDAALVESVSRFMSLGLADGGAAVIIATPEHRAAIEEHLGRSVDLSVARERGRFVSLDADETLSLFMRDGMPDAARFESALGDVVGTLPPGSDRRFFGEMVALLWNEGNKDAVVALEEIWNDFLTRNPARLFCAYPKEVLADGERGPIDGIRNCHSHILIATRDEL